MSKLWGGRFEAATHRDVEEYTSSLQLDSRLWMADIRGSIAHAEMLGRQKILSNGETEVIVQGLTDIHAALKDGELSIPSDAEDIHSAIEQLLTERLGPVAGKLHTARSRNDQVVTATRLYLRGEIDELRAELAHLQSKIIEEASLHVDTLLPGTTHLQHGQPVSLAHHLLAYFWMFDRDRARLVDLRKRVNQLPLGSGALAGTTLPIERESVARALGFDGLCENSLDAVSDRDFVVEFLNAGSLIAVHLSRLSEELILWSTPEYGFVALDDEVTTGSSLMPQKKNPDVAELIRGRMGRLTGAWIGAVTVLKGLPLSYNRDLQEDKVHLFSGLDTARSSVRLMKLMLERARWNTQKMESSCIGDHSNSTDLADYLVRKGVPFRQTHEIAGRAVRLAIEMGCPIEQLGLTLLQSLHPLFESDVFEKIQVRAVMESRNSRGGTGREAVRFQIQMAQEALNR